MKSIEATNQNSKNSVIPSPKFSVVLTTYLRDNALYLEQAIESVINQTVQPDEILVVVDGPIGSEISSVLDRCARTQRVIRVLRTEVNCGQGFARDIGIRNARNELIALMDSDDLAVPTRFELQIRKFEDADLGVVGGFIEEFNDVPGDMRRIRAVPLDHESIIKLARLRQPVNNVTVVFKRSAYLSSGGYKPIRWVEDYDLFYRMLNNNVKFENVSSTLVYVRGGDIQLSRRSGFSYLTAELALFKRMWQDSFITLPILFYSAAIRIIARLMPRKILGSVYGLLLRKAR